MIEKLKFFTKLSINWLWRGRVWSLTLAIIILAGLSIVLGTPCVPTIITVSIAVLINILTSYPPSKFKQYSKTFNKYTQIHIETLKDKVLKPQNFYIHREQIESGVRSLIEENKKGFAMIVGLAGSGKTNLLFNIASEYSTKNYSILFIESDLLENFKREKLENKPFSEILTSINAEEGKKPLLLIDTLDLIAYNKGIRKLIEFISDIKECDEAIIIGSIRPPEYENLKDKVVKVDKTFFLDRLSKDEVEALLKRYNKEVVLSEEILNLLTIPLFVHMFVEVYEGEEMPSVVNFIQLYEKYWEKKVKILRDGALSDYPQRDRDMVRKSKVRLAYLLASKMLQNQTIRFNKTDFLRNIKSLEAGELAYNDLVSEHILIEYCNYIEFFHQTFFEYTVVRYLLEERTGEQLNKLIEETNLEIPFYRGIFEYLALLSKNRDKMEIYKSIVDKLSRSPSHFQHILLVNLLSNLLKLEGYEIKTIENLVSKDVDSVDYMLGMIISEIWRPKETIFAVLEKLARRGNYEIKRKITEALPGLIMRNTKHSLKLMRILRFDYNEKWKTDNRRRVVEAIPYLIKNSYLEVDDFLRVREDDEFYVVIAVVETLDCLKSVSSEKANKLIELIENQLKDKKKVFVSWLLNLLEKIRLEPKGAIEMMKEVIYNKTPSLILETGDDVYRISIARNLPQLLRIFPDDVLEMMNVLVKPEEHKNVRRPLVRPVRDLVEFMLKEKAYKNKVEKVVWLLSTDEDEIIPGTFFDNFPYFIKIVPELSKRVVDYYLSEEGKEKLEHFSDEAKQTTIRRIKEAKQELESRIINHL